MKKRLNEKTPDAILSGLCSNLPANLKTLRTLNGLSQEQISQQLQMSRTSYNRIEKGRVFPDLLTVCLVVNLFGISLECLLYRNLKNHIDNTDCSGNSCYGSNCAEHKNHACRKG